MGLPAKPAMIEVAKLLEGKKTKMLLQVHDELVFDLHIDEHDLIPLIEEKMENALPLPHAVPAKVESDTGENWLAAH